LNIQASTIIAEFFRPILRGRDIQKYQALWSGLYIIGTFPSLKLDIDKFPAVKEHLLEFDYDRLKQTGEPGARKRTNNQWFEIQDSISYWEDFFKPKIIWGEISDKSKFSFDTHNYYCEATTFLLTGDKLKYLLAMLNSKLLEWYFNQIGTATGVGTNRWKKYTIEQLPIKIPTSETIVEVENYIDLIIGKNAVDGDANNILNTIVYNQYDLNAEEREYISNVNI
jgi:adenine-specific DNA-methyltransferase